MGYQALLFCPDEKTARTVTQVLTELEFAVEPCAETFAAVKKLMGQHFDAVVVDCDNEQNATLLFKSARNSTSNQASLAVAVVEGQAGVAKAFRIGANLVLTKPINIEQAKGTLRVARGLLRKGEPGKIAAAVPAQPAAPAAHPSPVPATSTSAKTVLPAKPAASASVPPSMPGQSPAWPAPAAVAGSPLSAHAAAQKHDAEQDDDLLEISLDDAPAAPEVPTVAPSPVAPGARASKLPSPAISSTTPTPAFTASRLATPTGGAASAPAPARTTQPPKVTDAPAKREELPETASAPISQPAAAPTSFTFGGAAVPEEKGGSKKLLLIVAAVVIIAAVYAGWSYFQGRSSQPVAPPPSSQPATRTLTSNPAPAQPAVSAKTPATSTSQPGPQLATQGPPPKNSALSSDTDASPSRGASPPASAKADASLADSKTGTEDKPAASPIMVKRGIAPASRAKSDAADIAPPSMIGIAPAGTTGSAPNIGSIESASKPVLQTVTVSQGVSQGLLIKSVAPIYPKSAMTMHIDGDVKLLATISKTGDITKVKAISGDNRLTMAAIEAVRQWKYKPYLLNGEPVEIQTTVILKFKSPN